MILRIFKMKCLHEGVELWQSAQTFKKRIMYGMFIPSLLDYVCVVVTIGSRQTFKFPCVDDGQQGYS